MLLFLFVLFVLCDQRLHHIAIWTASYFQEKQRKSTIITFVPSSCAVKDKRRFFICCIVCGKRLIRHHHLGAYCIMHHYSPPTLIHYKTWQTLSLSPLSCFTSRVCCLEPTVLLTVLCYCCMPLALRCSHSAGCSCLTWKNSVTK